MPQKTYQIKKGVTTVRAVQYQGDIAVLDSLGSYSLRCGLYFEGNDLFLKDPLYHTKIDRGNWVLNLNGFLASLDDDIFHRLFTPEIVKTEDILEIVRQQL